MSDKDTSREIFEQIQLICAGRAVKDAWQALADSLAATICFSADSIEHAEQLCDITAEDLKRSIRKNWVEVRAARSTGAERVIWSA